MKRHMKVEAEIKMLTNLVQKLYLMELENQQEKIKLMNNKAKLRDYRKEKIYINDDTTLKE